MDSLSSDWDGSSKSGSSGVFGELAHSQSLALRRFGAMPLPFIPLNESLGDKNEAETWRAKVSLSPELTSAVDCMLLATKDDDSRDSGIYSVDGDSPNGLTTDDGLQDVSPVGRVMNCPRRCLFEDSACSFSTNSPSFAQAFQKRFRESSHKQESHRKKRAFKSPHSDASAVTRLTHPRATAHVVDYDEIDLISDYSRPYGLPIAASGYQDLKAISSTTLSQLMDSNFLDAIHTYQIIDCRYPYEFQAGHITGAINIWRQSTLTDSFMPNHVTKINAAQQSNVIIFHCEFSSKRGPKMARFLRQLDRERNKDCYPSLHYPEIYILQGGYKAFYEQYPEMCDPESYKPMLHPDHLDEMKHFRIQSKAANKCSKSGCRRLQLIV